MINLLKYNKKETILRYTSVVSNRFDSATFKRLYADLYKDFTKPVSSRRFSVSC